MKSLALLAATAAIWCASPAAATLYFDFSYDGLGIGPTLGQLMTTDTTTLQADGREAYTITGITGSRGGGDYADPITGLVDAGVPFDEFGDYADNLLYTTGPLIDFYGFAYTISTAVGPYTINPYFNHGTYLEFFCCDDPLYYFTITPGEAPAEPPAAVPEAGTLGLLGLGTVGLGLARRRRRAPDAVSA